MTTKERAKKIVREFTTFHPVGYSEEMTPDIYTAKKHANIAVDLALSICTGIQFQYWCEVKKEIELL